MARAGARILRYKRKNRLFRARRIVTGFARFLVVFLVITFLVVLMLRWVSPLTTSFMLQHQISAWRAGTERPWIHYTWVDLDKISPNVSKAVVAAEDQRFPHHKGFDFHQIRHAVRERWTKGRVRGASTISQQVAKNLFLWPGRSWIRKGLEAYFTALIELAWPKRRILEVYLNIAQFGENVFGVGAASQRFFGKIPAVLTLHQAASLAAVLPNPKQMRAYSPSKYVRGRIKWIKAQVHKLGPEHFFTLRHRSN